jgi:hypothetical protein
VTWLRPAAGAARGDRVQPAATATMGDAGPVRRARIPVGDRGSKERVTLGQLSRACDTLYAAGWPAAGLEAGLLATDPVETVTQQAREQLTGALARLRGPATLRARGWYAEALLRLARGNRRAATSAVQAGCGSGRPPGHDQRDRPTRPCVRPPRAVGRARSADSLDGTDHRGCSPGRSRAGRATLVAASGQSARGRPARPPAGGTARDGDGGQPGAHAGSSPARLTARQVTLERQIRPLPAPTG